MLILRFLPYIKLRGMKYESLFFIFHGGLLFEAFPVHLCVIPSLKLHFRGCLDTWHKYLTSLSAMIALLFLFLGSIHMMGYDLFCLYSCAAFIRWNMTSFVYILVQHSYDGI